MRTLIAFFLGLSLVGCKSVPVQPESPSRIVQLNIESPPPLDLSSYKQRMEYILIKDGETYYIRTTLDSFNATVELLKLLGYRIEVLEITLDQYRNFYEPKEIE